MLSLQTNYIYIKPLGISLYIIWCFKICLGLNLRFEVLLLKDVKQT